jgi:photosystem II stability/assembly factor-like uncharacterized protein
MRSLILFNRLIIFFTIIFYGCPTQIDEIGRLFNFSINPGIVSVMAGDSVKININVWDNDGTVYLSLKDGLLPPFIKDSLNYTFNPANITNNGQSTLTINVPESVTPGEYNLYVYFNNEESNETADLKLTVTPKDGFQISLTQNQITIEQGKSDSVLVNTIKDAAFNESITFRSNTISGITAAFNPPTVDMTANSTNLKVTADLSLTPGNYKLIVTGTGSVQGYKSYDTLDITVIEKTAPWEEVTPTGTVAPLYSVSFPSENVGYVVGNTGTILKSQDGGRNWNTQNSGIITDLLGVEFLTTDFGFAVGRSGKILRTTDGGNNWVSKNSTTTILLSDIKILKDSSVWVAGTNRLLFSSNAGEDWSQKGVFNNITAIDFSYSDTGIVFYDFGSKFSTTTDGGNTWSSSNNFFNALNDIQYLNDLVAYACGSNGALYQTVDGGFNWTAGYLVGNASFYSIDFQNSVGYTVGDGGTFGDDLIYKYNGNWIRELTGLNNSISELQDIEIINSQNVIAVGYKAGNTGIIIRKK